MQQIEIEQAETKTQKKIDPKRVDSEQTDLQQMYLLALSSYQMGQYGISRDAFLSLVAAQPLQPHVWQGLAASYLLLGEYEASYNAAKIAHTISPTDVHITLLVVEAGIASFAASYDQMTEYKQAEYRQQELKDLLESSQSTQAALQDNSVAKKREQLYFLLKQLDARYYVGTTL